MATVTTTREVIGVCNLCEAICGLRLTVEDHQVTSVRGNPDDPLSRGHICPKGVSIGDIYSDPDRLRHPVKRVGNDWVEISWNEAFDLVADGLSRVINTHGSDAVGFYLGNPNVHSLGSMTHGLGMVKALRSRNTYSATSVDQLPHQLVSHLLYGHQLMLPVPDIDRTSYFLVFGANPMASNGSLMTAPDFPNRLRELKARGGRMVVFDPRRTETAKVATEHHFIRPGTDVYVLLAMVNVLFSDGLLDPPAYVTGIEDVAAAVAAFTPERAAEVGGVDAQEIRRVVNEFAKADSAVAYGRIGVSTTAFGSVAQWAIQMLNLLTGRLDAVGGAMFTSPAIDVIGRRIIGKGHHNAWQSRVRGLPETAGEFPVAALREEIETPGKGQIRALVTLSGNPVLSTPDGGALDSALDGLDFMVAVDIYINETTRHADVILPPTSALERDHYDLVFHTLAVRNTARFTPAVFSKSRDQRHDWEIYREVALRTAARLNRKASLRKRLELRARLTLSPTFLIGQLLRTDKSGVTISDLRKSPSGIDLGPLKPGLFPDRLATRDRLIHALPELIALDMARLDAEPRSADDLVLIGRRHQRDCNAWMHNIERLTKGQSRHELLMHPDDLASRSLSDGSRVRVTSRVGSVEV
ncbi:MAG: molybdopterin-dependent oxidoreductase, partial [Marmoricola sp.]